MYGRSEFSLDFFFSLLIVNFTLILLSRKWSRECLKKFIFHFYDFFFFHFHIAALWMGLMFNVINNWLCSKSQSVINLSLISSQFLLLMSLSHSCKWITRLWRCRRRVWVSGKMKINTLAHRQTICDFFHRRLLIMMRSLAGRGLEEKILRGGVRVLKFNLN